MRISSIVSLALIAWTFTTAACTPAKAPDARTANRCTESLEARCAREHCPTFEEEAAAARTPQPAGSFYRFSIASCGDYKLIMIQEGMGMGTDTFDASGKLVASSSVADAPVCDGNEFSTSSGVTIPKCEEKVLESGDYSQTDPS